MLNSVLACLAVLTWGASYWLFWERDLRRWWKGRHQRRAQEAKAREQAVRDYAAWVRNIPPPRSRAPVMPVPMPPAPPQSAPARQGVVVPFPRGGRAALRG